MRLSLRTLPFAKWFCPSKQELQKLAGEAIDLLYTEMN